MGYYAIYNLDIGYIGQIVEQICDLSQSRMSTFDSPREPKNSK